MKATDFIGMDITKAKEKLGYWWVLKHQSVPNYGTKADYNFVRYCLGEIHFKTEKNKVCSASFFPAVSCVANNGWDNEKRQADSSIGGNTMKNFTDYTKEERPMCGSRFVRFNKPNSKNETMSMEISRDKEKTEAGIKEFLYLTTYVYNGNNDCFMKYNPTVKTEIKRNGNGDVVLLHYVIDSSWHLEATAENEQKLIDETARRFYQGE